MFGLGPLDMEYLALLSIPFLECDGYHFLTHDFFTTWFVYCPDVGVLKIKRDMDPLSLN